ncbi:MAG TPA: hypothetical protein VFH51_07225, partial [Myxococcota bacterium]|nr:hypothetical protein [Myxococcota bacterium]
ALFTGAMASLDATRRTLERCAHRIPCPMDQSAYHMNMDPTPDVGAVWSPDSRWLATGTEDGCARAWDLRTGRSVLLQGHTACIDGAAWSPHGTMLATASRDGELRLWDVHRGTCLRVATPAPGMQLYNVSWSHDGRFVAAMAQDEPGDERVFVLVRLVAPTQRPGHRQGVRCRSLRPGGDARGRACLQPRR